MSDFFGHDLQFSQTPVEIDVNSILGVTEKKLPYRDLSQEGDFIDAEDAQAYKRQSSFSVDTSAFNQDPAAQATQRISKNLANALWGLGAFTAVWLIGNLAIASRTGGLNDIRAHHLGSASTAVPVLATLSAVATISAKNSKRI